MKTKYRFILSLGSGCLIALAVAAYLKSARDELNSHYVMTNVIRSKKFIPAGTVIRVDDVEEKLIPESFLEPLAITKIADMKGPDGPKYKTRSALQKGEQVSTSKLYDKDVIVGLAWLLNDGLNALTLRLNLEDAVAGLVRPGDWVNVLAVDQSRAWNVLKRVRILAIQDKMLESSHVELPSDSILVTFGVSSENALVLKNAAQKASLSLTLVSPLEGD